MVENTDHVKKKKKKGVYLATPSVGIRVAESSEEDLDSNLTGLRRSHLHVLDHQWLIGFPGHRRFCIFIAPNYRSQSEPHPSQSFHIYSHTHNHNHIYMYMHREIESTFAGDDLTLSSHERDWAPQMQRERERETVWVQIRQIIEFVDQPQLSRIYTQLCGVSRCDQIELTRTRGFPKCESAGFGFGSHEYCDCVCNL